MKERSSGSDQTFRLLEFFMAVMAAGLSVAVFFSLCQDFDEKMLVKQAQLPEEPASVLFDFEETYYYDPFLLAEERSDNFLAPLACSVAVSKDTLPSRDDFVEIQGRLKKGESLDTCLKRYGIGAKTRYRILTTLGKAVDLHRCMPGERFRLSFSEEGEVTALTWEKGPFEEYRVQLDDKGEYRLVRAPVMIEKRMVKASGRFTGGLYDSFATYGLNAKLARQFGEIFSSSVDFNSDLRVGDSFSVVFHKYYKDGELIGTGRILAAKYCRIGGSCTEAFYFEGQGTARAGYYRADGSLLSNSFLRSPLKVYKVTSRFNSKRFHPILKVYRPHYGVDLAAPIGTPVMAVGDGVVTFTGWQRGYGRIVVIEHRGGYKTYYGHLRRFAKGLRKGVKVHQKQVIGYVGKSGVATGPHLDYRVWHNGRFVDPFRVKVAAVQKLSRESLTRFLTTCRQLQTLLRDTVSSGIISVKTETFVAKPTDLAG